MKERLKSTHKKQLQNTVKNLNRIIKAIREYIPDANIFFENGCSLMIHSESLYRVGQEEWRSSQIFDAGYIENCDAGGY